MSKLSLTLIALFFAMTAIIANADPIPTPTPEPTVPDVQVLGCPAGSSELNTIECSATETGNGWERPGTPSLRDRCMAKLRPCIESDSCEMQGGTVYQTGVSTNSDREINPATGEISEGMTCTVSLLCCVPN